MKLTNTFLKAILTVSIVSLANSIGSVAFADIIVSVAMKKSTDTVRTNNNSTHTQSNTTVTNNCTKNNKNCTTNVVNSPDVVTTSNTSTESNSSEIDTGILIQYAPDSLPLVIGVGIFDDNSGMATLGLRF